jgi:HPt (histidine-containing phosphotransfer) domain-containing protein
MESTWHVKIPRAEVLKDKRGKSYISYTVHVLNGDYEWVINKRYSEFHELYEKIKSDFGGRLPDFPSKMLFGNFEPEAIVERRMQLQQFFQRIPKFFYDWQEFLIFFEVNNPVVKKKPITRKINFALELGGIHLEQFPDRIVTMDKEEFLVRFFIETIRHALQELGEIKSDFEYLFNVEERFELMERVKSKRQMLVQSIREAEMQIATLLQDPNVLVMPELCTLLVICGDHLRVALEWDKGVDEALLTELEWQSDNIEQRIRRYREQGEYWITRLVQISQGGGEELRARAQRQSRGVKHTNNNNIDESNENGDHVIIDEPKSEEDELQGEKPSFSENKSPRNSTNGLTSTTEDDASEHIITARTVRARLRSLLQQVDSDIDRYRSRGSEAILSQLMQISEWIRSQLSFLNISETADTDDQRVTDIESRVFNVLGEMQEQISDKLAEEVDKLKKAAANLRKELGQKTDMQAQALGNRVEDCQHYIADIEYQLQNKVTGLTARLRQAQINEANKRNESSDLYGEL